MANPRTAPAANRAERRRKYVTQAEAAEYLGVTARTIRQMIADGRLVEVRAAPEAVLKITGRLPRLAWHIGNRHTPCEILADHLLIREDHVLEAMLRHLGAGIERVVAPFSPEGGAYGHGRTMGHDHGHGHALGHGHAHDHDH